MTDKFHEIVAKSHLDRAAKLLAEADRLNANSQALMANADANIRKAERLTRANVFILGVAIGLAVVAMIVRLS